MENKTLYAADGQLTPHTLDEVELRMVGGVVNDDEPIESKVPPQAPKVEQVGMDLCGPVRSVVRQNDHRPFEAQNFGQHLAEMVHMSN